MYSLMAEIFSGGDKVDAAHLKPWTAEDEARIEKWPSQGEAGIVWPRFKP